MSKIFSLTKNEIIKQYKKTSILVMTIFILALAFIAPLGMKYINFSHDKSEFNQYMINNIQNNIDNLVIKTDADKLYKIIYEAEKEKYTLLKDYNKNNLGWIEEESSKFFEYEVFYNVAQLLMDGVKSEDITNNIYNINTNELDLILNATRSELPKIKDYYNKKAKASIEIIQTNDFFAFNQEQINEFKQNINDIEKEIKSENLDKEYIQGLESTLTRYKGDLKILEYYKNNKIVNDNLSWKSKLLNEINEAQITIKYEAVSEKEFTQNPAYASEYKMTYDEYKANFEQNKEKLQDKIDLNWYALENEIPPLGYINDARNSIDKIYNIFILVAVVFIAVIGSGIVANEFTRGTIRLLLIRPASRAKILLSKLLALLLIGFGLIAACILIITISSGIFFDFSTLFTPVLEIAKEGIVESNYFMYMLPRLFVSSTSLIFIGTLSFMLSIITKNTAISVALPIILLFIGDPLTNMLVSFNQKWIASTFVPYMNMPMLNITTNLSDLLSSQSGIILNNNLGAMWLLGLSAVFVTLGFINFTKKDIKN